jgi:hypothetical protein
VVLRRRSAFRPRRPGLAHDRPARRATTAIAPAALALAARRTGPSNPGALPRSRRPAPHLRAHAPRGPAQVLVEGGPGNHTSSPLPTMTALPSAPTPPGGTQSPTTAICSSSSGNSPQTRTACRSRGSQLPSPASPAFNPTQARGSGRHSKRSMSTNFYPCWLNPRHNEAGLCRHEIYSRQAAAGLPLLRGPRNRLLVCWDVGLPCDLGAHWACAHLRVQERGSRLSTVVARLEGPCRGDPSRRRALDFSLGSTSLLERYTPVNRWKPLRVNTPCLIRYGAFSDLRR